MPVVYKRKGWWRIAFRFWLIFIYETLTQRRLMPLVSARLYGEQRHVSGAENIPADGHFILAVNHYNGRWTLDGMAAALQTLDTLRPDAAANMLFIAGGRAAPQKGVLPKLVWRGMSWIQQRWQQHLIRITIKNNAPMVAGLRDWRQRQQPMFVFPEGRGKLTLGRMRRGTGRWLHLFGAPVVPVAVWWAQDEAGEAWHIVFGKPLVWTSRSELRDLQLGLALAALLPADLAPDWQPDLARWRAAHEAVTEDAKEN